MFQFHKVRLKGDDPEYDNYKEKQFQFHKVRLKGILDVFLVDEVMFQFHKVRLKAFCQQTIKFLN